MVFAGTENLVGHRIQDHHFSSGGAGTGPGVRSAFFYNAEAQPHGHHRSDATQSRVALLQIDNRCSNPQNIGAWLGDYGQLFFESIN
jgi:hypothetical protein